MTTAPPALPATPIFDEVDRWWRDGGDEPAPGTMLSFTATRSRAFRTATSPSASPSGPRHQLVSPA
jgi:hypothetical protein